MISLSQIAQELGVKLVGEDKQISNLNTLKDGSSNELSYIESEKYLESLKNTKIGAVLVSEKLAPFVPSHTSKLIIENPHLGIAYASKIFASFFEKLERGEAQISSHAQIAPSVHVGKGCKIEEGVKLMHGVYVGDGVRIGKNTLVHPNAVIYENSIIGENCTILANAVIGSDGFGYAHTKLGEHIKIHHLGHVELEDFVDIGACTTVDRGVFGKTLIKKGTKIDNLVQIGHNCELAEQCIIVSQVGLSGSTKLGKNVIMGGQSATAGHLSIGDFATVAARGGVTKSLEGGKIYSGFPTILHKDWLKLQAKLSKFLKN